MARRRELEREVLGLVLRQAHRMTHSAAARLRDEGMTPATYQLLLAVRREPGARQQQLAERLSVTKGNVSMLVTQLERAGLLQRAPEGPANSLHLTPAGAALAERLLPDQDAWTHEQFADLRVADLETLASLLRRMP